jgi:hypothetical protein
VRERAYIGGVDGQDGVEEVGEADALGFGDQAEESAVAVEAPRAALLDDLEPGLVVAVEEAVVDLACGVLVSELEGVGAKPLGLDDCRQRVGDQATQRRAGSQFLELGDKRSS